jgi:hypothetical protein
MIEDLGQSVDATRTKLLLEAFAADGRDVAVVLATGFLEFLTNNVSKHKTFFVGQAVMMSHPKAVFDGVVETEPWFIQLKDKLAQFDVDRDDAFDQPELATFFRVIMEGYHAARCVMGVVARQLFGAVQDSGSVTPLARVLDLYSEESIMRASEVRRDLESLGIDSTVPERPSELPSPPPVLGVVCTVNSCREQAATAAGARYTVTVVGWEGPVQYPDVRPDLLQIALSRDFDVVKDSILNDYLEALTERIGPDPGGTAWQMEVPVAIKGDLVQRGMLMSMDDPQYERLVADFAPWATSFDGFCKEKQDEIDRKMKKTKLAMTVEENQVNFVFSCYGDVLGTAVRDSVSDFAGLTHKYQNMLTRFAMDAEPAVACYHFLQQTTGIQHGGRGLQDSDPHWAQLVKGSVAEALASGKSKLQGVHSVMCAEQVVVHQARPRNLAPSGARYMSVSHDQEFLAQDSTIIRFVSTEADATGLHTAVSLDPENAIFPAMTLFIATEVKLQSFEYDGTDDLLRVCKEDFGRAPTPVLDADGRLHVGREQLIKWLAENDEPALPGDSYDPSYLVKPGSKKHQRAIDYFHGQWLPKGADGTIYNVNQTLITVQATFLIPTACLPIVPTSCAKSSTIDRAVDKLTADSSDLGYGDRMAYVRGISEIVFSPPLTMAEEWARNHEWSDWTGCSFCGSEEWDYVWNQPAAEGRGGVLGFDEGHTGMMLACFRERFTQQVVAAGGSDDLIPTLEEVAAARLYTGPGEEYAACMCFASAHSLFIFVAAYVKLNGFMRLLGNVPERHWRARFAQLHNFSYSCTVRHLVNAIRKITKISALQQQKSGERQEEVMLYRGVRGKMPDSFYKPDVQGLITAVDFGFVSTSTDPNVPVSFMTPDALNVLWVMHGSHGTDSAGRLHNGAVLQPLSQFPAEAETLLPPLCMLQVRKDEAAGAFLIEDKQGTNKKGETVVYREIHVTPCFV